MNWKTVFFSKPTGFALVCTGAVLLTLACLLPVILVNKFEEELYSKLRPSDWSDAELLNWATVGDASGHALSNVVHIYMYNLTNRYQFSLGERAKIVEVNFTALGRNNHNIQLPSAAIRPEPISSLYCCRLDRMCSAK